MQPIESKPYRIDCLRTKHECWRYDDPDVKTLGLDGRSVQLLLPRYQPDFELLRSATSGDPLFLIGRITPDEVEDEEMTPDGPLEVSIITRRLDSDRDTAVTWHEHDPWVFENLGLDGQATTPAGGADG